MLCSLHGMFDPITRETFYSSQNNIFFFSQKENKINQKEQKESQNYRFFCRLSHSVPFHFHFALKFDIEPIQCQTISTHSKPAYFSCFHSFLLILLSRWSNSFKPMSNIIHFFILCSFYRIFRKEIFQLTLNNNKFQQFFFFVNVNKFFFFFLNQLYFCFGHIQT